MKFWLIPIFFKPHYKMFKKVSKALMLKTWQYTLLSSSCETHLPISLIKKILFRPGWSKWQKLSVDFRQSRKVTELLMDFLKNTIFLIHVKEQKYQAQNKYNIKLNNTVLPKTLWFLQRFWEFELRSPTYPSHDDW